MSSRQVPAPGEVSSGTGPSGMPESLYGRVDLNEMGVRAGRETAPVKPAKAPVGWQKAPVKLNKDFGSLGYKPKTKETKQVFEYLASLVHTLLGGDVPHDATLSATDDVLRLLKTDEDLMDLDRKARLEALLGGSIAIEVFQQMANLAKRITDYQVSNKPVQEDVGQDEDSGVAVVFAADDDEEDEDGEGELGYAPSEGEEAELVPSFPLFKEDTANVLFEEDDQIEPTNISSLMDVVTEEAKTIIDLDSLAFPEGGHTMTNAKCVVPEGAFKRSGPGYEEIHIPAKEPRPMDAGEHLVEVSSLPAWTHAAFDGIQALNRVQSRVFPYAFNEDGNMLMCAPTGAGKTNVALLAILREIGKHLLPDGQVNLEACKIVYVAPMKALVQEMVNTFTKRLSPYGLQVAELTGDVQLGQAQLAQTQLIVTTPEKWDVVTRKGGEAGHFTRLVRLVVIDEIHLLHDARGPVLEALVARTLRTAELTQEWTRLVGLSATLPNYGDVGRFLRCSREAVFHFDTSYRPCPLAQEFIGITEKNALKRLTLMNNLVYAQVAERAGRVQTIVFVHGRKDTVRTAKHILTQAIAQKTITKFQPVAEEDLMGVQSAELASLLPHGLAVHHAGLSRSDRQLVEGLFAEGRISALVSTATLAWGVNLPAHTVIIKGTQVYSPELGTWVPLSPQDTLQMLGRAGRPQYDRQGEGIVITQHADLQFYLSLLTSQLPIESQLICKLLDHVNAELVAGSITALSEAVEWIGYTYLTVRMSRSPGLYRCKDVKERRFQLAHSALSALDKAGLARYDIRTGRVQPTELGRIASHYYLSSQSMATYVQHLRPHHGSSDILRVFSLSHEFALLPLRQEERSELARLAEQVPIPVHGESLEESSGKINVLLQAYISRLGLTGFALAADMLHVTQSASRILRALFELALRRGWSALAKRILGLCKAVQQRQWLAQTPLRQTASQVLPADLLRRLEARDFPFERLFDLNAAELGELVRAPKLGLALKEQLEAFPRLSITRVEAVPVGNDLLRIDAVVKPNFTWNEVVHGKAILFHVLLEDSDEEHVLHTDTLIIKERNVGQEHYISMTVPLLDPLPPVYFLSLLSDRFLAADAREAVMLNRLILPDDGAQLNDPDHGASKSVSTAVGSIPGLAEKYASIGITEMNPIQASVLPALFRANENVLVGAPAGSGRTLMAELAIARSLAENPTGRIVYLCPHPGQEAKLVGHLSGLFSHLLPAGRAIVRLIGDSAKDLKLLELSSICVSSPTAWDMLSRRWKTRKVIQSISLVIADDLHMLASQPVLESVLGRMRYISAFMEGNGKPPIRIVGLSLPLACSKDVAAWLGVSSACHFNFGMDAREIRLAIHLQAFGGSHQDSRLLAMQRPTNKLGCSKIVFAEDRQAARLALSALVSLVNAEALRSGHEASKSEEKLAANDLLLREGLEFGIGLLVEPYCQDIEHLFLSGAISTLIVLQENLYDMSPAVRADAVVIQGTQAWSGAEGRFVDYPIAQIQSMLGKARTEALVCCSPPSKASLKKLLPAPLPLESFLGEGSNLPGLLCAEIVSGTLRSPQDAVDYLTWSLLYRRLAHNPSFYGLPERSARALSEHLSQLIESAVDELETAKCIEVEGDSLSPLNLGIVAAHYNLSHLTIEMYALSLQVSTRLRGVLEIVSAAAEFDNLPIRRGEWKDLAAVEAMCPIQPQATPRWNDPHAKTMTLLQAHFSRLALTPELEADQRAILPVCQRAVQAMVDVIASHGWLQPALSSMEFSQMLIQAQWDQDSPLKQLPFMSSTLVTMATRDLGIESVFDLIDDEAKRTALTSRLDRSQIAALAAAVNKYPNVELEYELDTSQDVTAGDSVKLSATLKRLDGLSSDLSVPAPFFPEPREEVWWLVLGNPSERTLLAIKRFSPKAGQAAIPLTLEFTAPPSSASLKLYLISECWLGCDQEFDLSISVKDD